MPRSQNEYFGCARMDSETLHHRAFPLPGDRPQYTPSRRIDVTHIRLELSLDFERRCITGNATLKVRSLSDRLVVAELDAVGLEIEEVSVDGVPANFDLADDLVRITLPEPAAWGTGLELNISYSAQPERGLFFIAPDEAYPDKHPHVWTQSQDIDARHWFPCYNLPGDKSTSEMIVTVPAGMFALSNGRLVSTRENEAASRTFHWQQEIPHSHYLITLVAGPYVEIPYRWEDIPVPTYVLPGREEHARLAFPQTPDMIAFFSDKIGVRYPYAQYAQICVSDYIMGGMEHTTATTLTDTFLPDATVMPEWEGRSLIAHELAHQWFGDLLTCRDWSHGWLNEGFATYFDALWHEHAYGVDEFRYMMHQNAQEYIEEDSSKYRRPIVERTYNQPIDIFDRHLYPKGAWVLHMIRRQLGDEGWWRTIQHYVERHREQTVITSDLERAIEAVTGLNLEKFFEQWIFTGGHPEFRVAYSWDEERQVARVEVEQKQQTDRLTPIFDLPIDLLIEVDGQEQRLRVRVNEVRHTFFIPLAGRPQRIRFDPEAAILKTLDFPRPYAMLAYQLEHDPDVSGRIEAAVELGKKAERRGVQALATALEREPFWGVAVEIARALGVARTPAAKQALLGALTHADPRVRRAVVEHLAQFTHDDEVAQALVTRLGENEPSPHVRGELVKSLGTLKASSTREAVDSALEQASWNDVIRCRALDALGALDDPDGVPLVLEWTQYGRSTQARMAAIAALGNLGKHADQRHAVVERLIELLDDPSMRVKNAAIRALGTIGDKAALSALDRAVERARHGSTTRTARVAARAIHDQSAQSDEIGRLRADLDKLAGENRTLRERVDALEQTGS